ncbi:MAG: ribose-5-phosphate isomerase RpiA [Anaerolineae bacterium]
MNATTDKLKAAQHAVSHVASGMVVGLGHGSTALLAVRLLAHRLHEGHIRNVRGVPCSSFIAEEAHQMGISLTTPDAHPVVDITLDGADEVDPDLDMIKGGGGALLREKMVAQASRREIIMVDQSKLSDVLGNRWAVPIEVVPFGWGAQVTYLDTLGGRAVRRMTAANTPFRTDQGNFVLDCRFGPIQDPPELARQLDSRAGIVAHGLFLGLATDLVVAGPDGVHHIQRKTDDEHD